MHTILSIDPGRTTGYCIGVLTDRVLYLAPNQLDLTLLEMYDMLAYFERLTPGDHRLHIVYETFEYRNVARQGLDLTPVKLIGVIELFYEQYGTWVTFHKQSAAEGKAHYSNDLLKKLGVYRKGCEHGRDAERHLLHWLTFKAGSQLADVESTQLVLTDEAWLLGAYYNHEPLLKR
jgi:hypothetical protein